MEARYVPYMHVGDTSYINLVTNPMQNNGDGDREKRKRKWVRNIKCVPSACMRSKGYCTWSVCVCVCLSVCSNTSRNYASNKKY